MKHIKYTVSSSRQAVRLEAVYKIEDKKLSITIVSDSYESQCRAFAQLWDGTKWNMVTHIPSSEMKTPTKLRYVNCTSTQLERHFDRDHNELLRVAKLIIL